METTTFISYDNNCSSPQSNGRCSKVNIFNVSSLEDVTENSSQTGILDFSNDLETRRLSPLISDELTYILELIIIVIGLYVTSFFGVGANIVNTIVYAKQGLKDSITFGLFALSISDLILVTLPLVTASCHAADYIMPDSPIDFPSIHYASSGWMRNMMYSMSCLITAFLSLERCCCIILPFKVKSIFTLSKTAFTLGIAFLIQLACILMLPAAYELTWWPSYNYSVSNNMSRIFRVVFFEEGEAIEVFNTTAMSLVVPSVTQGIVTVCVVVMIHGLRASAKFRNKSTTSAKPDGKGKVYTIDNEKSSYDPETQMTDMTSSDSIKNGYQANQKTAGPKSVEENGKIRNHNMSGRDARLIKTMIFLVTIQSACNIPFLAATFAWRSIPEMNIGMPYENTLKVVFSLVYLLGNLNASCNVFVYYRTSSSFRAMLGTMCCGRKQMGK